MRIETEEYFAVDPDDYSEDADAAGAVPWVRFEASNEAQVAKEFIRQKLEAMGRRWTDLRNGEQRFVLVRGPYGDRALVVEVQYVVHLDVRDL